MPFEATCYFGPNWIHKRRKMMQMQQQQQQQVVANNNNDGDEKKNKEIKEFEIQIKPTKNFYEMFEDIKKNINKKVGNKGDNINTKNYTNGNKIKENEKGNDDKNYKKKKFGCSINLSWFFDLPIIFNKNMNEGINMSDFKDEENNKMEEPYSDFRSSIDKGFEGGIKNSDYRSSLDKGLEGEIINSNHRSSLDKGLEGGIKNSNHRSSLDKGLEGGIKNSNHRSSLDKGLKGGIKNSNCRSSLDKGLKGGIKNSNYRTSIDEGFEGGIKKCDFSSNLDKGFEGGIKKSASADSFGIGSDKSGFISEEDYVELDNKHRSSKDSIKSRRFSIRSGRAVRSSNEALANEIILRKIDVENQPEVNIFNNNAESVAQHDDPHFLNTVAVVTDNINVIDESCNATRNNNATTKVDEIKSNKLTYYTYLENYLSKFKIFDFSKDNNSKTSTTNCVNFSETELSIGSTRLKSSISLPTLTTSSTDDYESIEYNTYNLMTITSQQRFIDPNIGNFDYYNLNYFDNITIDDSTTDFKSVCDNTSCNCDKLKIYSNNSLLNTITADVDNCFIKISNENHNQMLSSTTLTSSLTSDKIKKESGSIKSNYKNCYTIKRSITDPSIILIKPPSNIECHNNFNNKKNNSDHNQRKDICVKINTNSNDFYMHGKLIESPNLIYYKNNDPAINNNKFYNNLKIMRDYFDEIFKVSPLKYFLSPNYHENHRRHHHHNHDRFHIHYDTKNYHQGCNHRNLINNDTISNKKKHQ